MADFGTCEGETCWRNGCQGVIAEHAVENCSCHINPPCGSCAKPREFCPVCDWIAEADVEPFNDHLIKVNPADRGGAWEWWKPRPLDPRKLDYRSSSHSNSSMIKEGVYPPEMTREEVEREVRGTFGGRFASFGDGKFKYIAYTD